MLKRHNIIILPLTFALILGASSCSRNVAPQSSASSSASSSQSASSQISSSSLNESGNSSFKILSETKPILSDKSSSYQSIELPVPDNLKTTVSGIYFLNDDEIVFSAVNGKTDVDTEKNYDLYKYNLKSKALNKICSGFMLYIDDTITVKDTDNFSICGDGSYVRIENGKTAEIHYFRDESKKANINNVNDAIYNEVAGKLLYSVTNKGGNITDIYLSNINFSSSERLPFENVYRIQWEGNDHVLVAYKDGSKSMLADYSVKDKSSVLTELPDNNYFIDPLVCDNGLIRFFYLEVNDSKAPYGFLDVQKGTISRVLFDEANPISLMRSGKMAAFSESGSYPNTVSTLYLYDTATNQSIICGTKVKNPDTAAVSPNGTTIVYTCSVANGNKVLDNFYINQAE
jgi:hypothetical protein